MKVCAVPTCKNDSYKRPDLTFFSLPRTSNVRQEWIEAIGGKMGTSTNFIKVCQIHFKPKDFSNGKNQLKFHAVPVLNLGPDKSNPIDSDDEFTMLDSDSDLEVLEVSSSKERKKEVSLEKFPDKEEKCEEQEPEVEEENRRRPTRAAARVAAKKIHNTARNSGVNADDSVYVPASPRSVHRQKFRHTMKVEHGDVELDLFMECEEEFLSEVQAESMLKAQLEYNQVMKRLRTLRAENCKIIEVDTYDINTLKSSPVPVLLSTSPVS